MTIVAADSLLERLRGTGTSRPRADPELAGGLREWLEDALWEVALRLPPQARAIHLDDRERRRIGTGSPASPEETALRNFVGCLFRQWLTSRNFDDPFEDALVAHSVAGDPDGSVALVSGMPAARRDVLAAQLREHAEKIASAWPSLSASWRPRTSERILIPLCGRRILLSTRIDLAVGHQAVENATVCVVRAEPRPAELADGADLHFAALLETLRAGAPPVRSAKFHTCSGQLSVERVDEHRLVRALLETVESVKRLCR